MSPRIDKGHAGSASRDPGKTSVAVGEAIHDMVPGSQFVVLHGPGHVSCVEAPDEVTRTLRRFLHSVH